MSKDTPQGSVAMPRHKRGFKAFWVEVGRELKKVNWPPHRETNRLTGVVLVICGMIIAFLLTFHEVVHFLVTSITSGR